LDVLPSEVSRELFAQGRSVSLDAEQTLFLAGDEGDGCYRVEEGLLKASVGAPNGSERILGILGPDSVVGELSMIDGAPRSASVTASAIPNCVLLAKRISTQSGNPARTSTAT
jgi:CRP/FNR family transcriptional regulator, cyclic AMP receptor protein